MMTVIPWASPEAINAMTLPQLLNLKESKPPNKATLESGEEWAARYARRKAERDAEERAWTDENR